MILGYDDSKNVDGRFYEFYYKTIVKRTPKSEQFKCFENNTLETFELTTSIFCRDLKSFLHIVSSWRDAFGIYSYVPIGGVTPVQSLLASQVVDLIFQRNKFKYLPHYNELYDYIR